MVTTLDEVVGLLDLEAPGHGVFVAQQSELARRTRHVFGGLVAAQAVVAACRTVEPDRPMHSLHAYFLRPGDADVPIEFRVEQTRDGRSFSHRRVSAVQHGRAIMEMASSFATPEPGLSHQLTAPVAADPEGLARDVDTIAGLAVDDPSVITSGPFDVRSVEPHSLVARGLDQRTDRSLMWMRAAADLPDDPVLHAALLVYSTDMTVLDPTTRPHAKSMLAGDVLPATIDHAVWFHAPVRVDRWCLYDVDSPWAGHGRGFARGRVFDHAGVLVAEIAQEGLIRLPPG